APDEGHALGRVGERFVPFVQRLIFFARDWVIGIALGRRIFKGDRRARRLLPGQMLVFGDAGVGYVEVRVIDRPDRLMLLLRDCLVIELEAAVRQLAEAIIEIFVDRAGVDDV